MVVHPAPTSPQQRLKEASLPADWSQTPIQQPPRTPWGRIILLVLGVCLIVTAGLMAGWGIVLQRYSDSWVAQWWPDATTTTVVRQERAISDEIPAAVHRAAEQVMSLAPAVKNGEIYVPDDALTPSVPLSGGGWALAWDAAVPFDTALVLLPHLGDPIQAAGRFKDPATPFVFLKTDEFSVAPVSLVDSLERIAGQRIWLVTSRAREISILSRRVVGWAGPIRHSSDRLERWLALDGEVDAPAGSAAFDRDGNLVGLWGPNQRLWPSQSIGAVLKPLLQLHQVERPALGIRGFDLSRSLVPGQPTLSGWRLAAENDEPAVIPDSPGADAGLEAGDILKTINGQAPDPDLFTALSNYRPGQTVRLAFQRDGVAKEVSLVIGTLRP